MMNAVALLVISSLLLYVVPVSSLSCIDCVGTYQKCNTTSPSTTCQADELCTLQVKWKENDKFWIIKGCYKKRSCNNKIAYRNTPGCSSGVVLDKCFYCCDKDNCNSDVFSYWPELINDPCDPNPCLNQGVCVANFEGFELGKLNINESTYSYPWYPRILERFRSNIALANGTEDTPGHVCYCTDGFTGENCENVIDPCASNPCLNGGTCVSNGAAGFTCNCDSLFAGPLCEDDVDLPWACGSAPCLNGGTCTDITPYVYLCDCDWPFLGEECEEEYDACETEPCLNGGTCVPDPYGSFYCDCPVDWHGASCELT